MRYSKLIIVLMFAVLLLMLGMLVADVTSYSSMPTQSQKVATVIPKDGTIYHPYPVDATPYGNNDTWDVLTVKGHEKWREPETVYVIRSGDYISYQGQEYQVSGINRKALTMSAVIQGN